MQRHFVSYPKSGRTWVRYMLGRVDANHGVAFHHDGFEFNDGARPPHDFDLASRIERYRHVDRLIYLERDPRDVMVSLYHQVTGRFRSFFQYEGSLAEFIRDDYFGAANLQRFRTMWAAIAQELGFPIIRYEECHADARVVLERIAGYYGIDTDDDALARAVEEARFENMEAVEQSGDFPEPWLRLKDGFPKVREGKVGGHRSVLAPEDVLWLDRTFSS